MDYCCSISAVLFSVCVLPRSMHPPARAAIGRRMHRMPLLGQDKSNSCKCPRRISRSLSGFCTIHPPTRFPFHHPPAKIITRLRSRRTLAHRHLFTCHFSRISPDVPIPECPAQALSQSPADDFTVIPVGRVNHPTQARDCESIVIKRAGSGAILFLVSQPEPRSLHAPAILYLQPPYTFPLSL